MPLRTPTISPDMRFSDTYVPEPPLIDPGDPRSLRGLTRSPAIDSKMRQSNDYVVNPSNSNSRTNLRSGLPEPSQAPPFNKDANILPTPSESTYTLPRPSESTKGSYTLPRPGESTKGSYTLPRPGESTKGSYILPRPDGNIGAGKQIETFGENARLPDTVPLPLPKPNPVRPTPGESYQLPAPASIKPQGDGPGSISDDFKRLFPSKDVKMDLKTAQSTEILRQGRKKDIPNVNIKDSGINQGPVGTSSQAKASNIGKAPNSPLRGDQVDSFEFQPFLRRPMDPEIAAQNRQRQLQALDFTRYKTLKGKLNNIPNFMKIQKALDDASPSPPLRLSQQAAQAAEPAMETLSKLAVISQRVGSVNIDEAQEASRALIAFLKESATPSIKRLEGSLAAPGTYMDVPNSLKGLSENPGYPNWMKLQASSRDGMNLRDNPQMMGFGTDDASKAFKSDADVFKIKMQNALGTSDYRNLMKFDVRGRPEFYQEIKAGDDILNDPTTSILNKNEVIQRIYKRIESDIQLIKNEPQDSLVRLRKYSEMMGWIEVLEKPRSWEGLLGPIRLDKLQLIELDTSLPAYVRTYAGNAWRRVDGRNQKFAKGIVLESLPDAHKGAYSQMLDWDKTFRGLMEDHKRFSQLRVTWDQGGPLPYQEWEQLRRWKQKTLPLIKQFAKGYASENPSLGWLNNLKRDVVEDKLKLIKLTPSSFPEIRDFAAKQLGKLKPHVGKDPLPQDNSYGIPGFLNRNGLSKP